ncbi:MAG: hypothetical protein KDC06_12370, partial [Chitinophagaceae bacterium]|nr:hypothetical protein [Chitinophagaceae bacterium]
MKVKLFGLAAIFLLLGIQTNINSQAQDYIMLESGFGSLDKQIPVIVFSIENYDKDVSMYGGVFYVNKCEFLQMNDEIKESEILNEVDTLDTGYYNFFVIKNNVKRLYITSDKESTIKLFNLLVKTIEVEDK